VLPPFRASPTWPPESRAGPSTMPRSRRPQRPDTRSWPGSFARGLFAEAATWREHVGRSEEASRGRSTGSSERLRPLFSVSGGCRGSDERRRHLHGLQRGKRKLWGHPLRRAISPRGDDYGGPADAQGVRSGHRGSATGRSLRDLPAGSLGARRSSSPLDPCVGRRERAGHREEDDEARNAVSTGLSPWGHRGRGPPSLGPGTTIERFSVRPNRL